MEIGRPLKKELGIFQFHLSIRNHSPERANGILYVLLFWGKLIKLWPYWELISKENYKGIYWTLDISAPYFPVWQQKRIGQFFGLSWDGPYPVWFTRLAAYPNIFRPLRKMFNCRITYPVSFPHFQ